MTRVRFVRGAKVLHITKRRRFAPTTNTSPKVAGRTSWKDLSDGRRAVRGGGIKKFAKEMS